MMVRPCLVPSSLMLHQPCDGLISAQLFMQTHREQCCKKTAFFRWMFGNVRDPQLIRTRRGEVTIYQVTDRSISNQVTACRAPFRKSMQLQFLHNRGYEFVIHNQPRLNP